MKIKMWKQLQNTDLYLQCNYCDSDPEVFVTDFVKVWAVTFSKSGFLTCVKESNSGMDIDDDDLDKCKKMLMDPETLKSERTDAVKDGTTLSLAIMGNKAVFGYPLHLMLKLEEGSKELFFQKVTQPLLVSIQDLRASEKELTQLLRKKDEEIEEYKCEGGAIALRHLKTVPFNENGHKKKHAAFDEHFGEICERLTKRREPLPLQILAVTAKSEPVLPSQVLPPVKKEDNSTSSTLKTEVKSEPSSQTNIDLDSPRKKLRKKLNI